MKRRRTTELVDEIEEGTEEPEVDDDPIDPEKLIHSGSTLLNLACTDHIEGAYKFGKMATVPGQSAAGKTLLMLTMLAECSIDPRFDPYDLVYDDGEESNSFNILKIFGPRLAQRLEPPRKDKEGSPIYSETIQDLKANILLRCDTGRPFIYVMDSLDSLSSEEELKKEYLKALNQSKSEEERKEIKGSYNAEIAKGLGQVLRMVTNKMAKSESGLFIVQQERDDFKSRIPGAKTTSGGHAPVFYSSQRPWLKILQQITKTSMGIEEKIGNKVEARVMKNKSTGKRRNVRFDIFEDYGVDDIGSCIDFLTKTKHWETEKQTILAKELDFKGTRHSLIRYIEKNNCLTDLRALTGGIWRLKEEGLHLGRKRRFE